MNEDEEDYLYPTQEDVAQEEIQDYAHRARIERAAAWTTDGEPKYVDPVTGEKFYSSGYNHRE